MNPLQKAAIRRKAIYFAVILGLFTLSMFWRGIIPIPLSDLARAPANSAQRAANWTASRTILNQSFALDLRELEKGEPEIAGESARLGLIGSRGIVVAYLWNSAIDKQKRNDFHKMDRLIDAVTRLQPHFIAPWIFQSWNIAYNVSVEMHGSGDMYFYIARGIELLAEGERRNSHTVKEPGGGERKLGSPDMRYQLAFYYQNKFGVSDTVEVLRCLFQLSCIPPDERNPDRYIDPKTGAVDLVAFRGFCEKYPHLVRRLRGEDRDALAKADDKTKQKILEALKCPTPADVVQFLRDNRDVPSLYKSKTELADSDKQFPALPPKFTEGEGEAHPGMPLGDDFTAFKAARAWFTYGLVPLPPTEVDDQGRPVPSATPRPAPALPPRAGEYDPVRFRVPRQPLLIIYRQGAPRVQSYQAEMEQKEGWFDDEGWQIDDPADTNRNNWWFPELAAAGTPLVVGRERPWSLQEWQKAAEMWEKHGQVNGLILSESRLAGYREDARRGPGGNLLSEPTEEQLQDPVFKRWYQATTAQYYYQQNRQVTNFPFFVASSQGEAKMVGGKAVTVLARKTLWQAEQARKLGKYPLATRLYAGEVDEKGQLVKPGGLQMWREVLRGDREFHRPGSTTIEEQTYEYELAYLRLIVQDDERVRAKSNEIAHVLQSVVPFLTEPFPTATPQWGREQREEIKWYVAEKYFSPLAGVMDVDDDRRGTPWVTKYIKESVQMQQGIRGPQQPPPGGPPMMPASVPSVPSVPGSGQ